MDIDGASVEVSDVVDVLLVVRSHGVLLLTVLIISPAVGSPDLLSPNVLSVAPLEAPTTSLNSPEEIPLLEESFWRA